MRMRRMKLFNSLFVALVVVVLNAVFLGAEELLRSRGRADSDRSEGRLLTPSDRIRLNADKLKNNPDLRGRSDKSALLDPKDKYAIEPSLPMKVLSDLKKDAEVAALPVRLKIGSEKGVVVVDGVVNNEKEKALIERKVSAMAGVGKIQSRLKIKKSNRELLEE